MRSAVLACVFAAALLASPIASTQDAAVPVLSEHPVEGTNVRRMQSDTVIRAPFDVVAQQVLDYARYPDFLRRVRTARVVRRDRAQTDVYFQLDLPRAMGTIWFLHRMTVVRVGADRMEIRGAAQAGNVGRVETRVTIERVVGTRSTRFSFALFGLPVVPAMPDTVNGTLRDAVRAAAVLLQQRVEREQAMNHR